MTHTFFINASSGTFERYRDLVEMEMEKRKLLTPDLLHGGENTYPIREWYGLKGEKRAYERCADRITEIIDSDKNVADEFNLLIYIDLNEIPEYTAVSKENASAKLHCRQALRRILRAFVYHTLYAELEKRGSEPKETLLILDTGCEPLDLEESPARTHEYQCELLGLNEAFYAEYTAAQASEERFETLFLRERPESSAFWQGVRESYAADLKRLFANGAPEISDRLLVGELAKTERFYYVNKVKTVLFEENRFAAEKSMREYARVKIRLYVYILQCAERETFTVNQTALGGDESVMGLHTIDMEAVKTVLHRKYAMYDEEYQKIPSDGACAEIKKTFRGKMKELPYEAYGLDQYGAKTEADDARILKNLKISAEMQAYLQTDVMKDPKPKADGSEEEDEERKAEVTGVFRIKSAEELVEKASALKKLHGDFSKILKTGVNVLLSDYAQSSAFGDVKLPPRNPNEEKPRYLLETVGSRDFTQENAQDFSEKAYQSAKEEYLKANRVYTVSATAIDEQYAWVKRRAKEIEESIASLKISVLIASGLLFCAFLPFFIIQRNLIFESLITVSFAALTAIIPFVILFSVFGYLIGREREGYTEVYKEFLENTEKAVRKNKCAWNAYLRLLDTKIPALRYLYEYKTDVDGAFRDYRIDRGKCRYHRALLQRRRETVGNILEDLAEIPGAVRAEKMPRRHLDYEKAFSCGENAEFYSILTGEDIAVITKTEGEER